ncbi:hypothetical protein ACFV0R_31805 [Streptomyces sp. NPDC059578]|uniref:SCO2584 family spore wall biosynthesis protein n=1 Tax=unclassified Streptomyces TaxID=2593676 RepID=UPI0036693427
MPEDVGGTPLPGGDEPDDRDHGGADEEFASVVFDEDFIRAAPVREPSAVERLLTAAEARAEAEGRPAGTRGGHPDNDPDDPDARALDAFGEGRSYDPDDRYARDILEESYGRSDTFMGHARWHRPIAWLLALAMGVGMVALAFAAVYRGAASNRQDPAPRPSSTELGQGPSTPPSAPPATPPDGFRSPASAVPRTP